MYRVTCIEIIICWYKKCPSHLSKIPAGSDESGKVLRRFCGIEYGGCELDYPSGIVVLCDEDEGQALVASSDGRRNWREGWRDTQNINSHNKKH